METGSECGVGRATCKSVVGATSGDALQVRSALGVAEKGARGVFALLGASNQQHTVAAGIAARSLFARSIFRRSHAKLWAVQHDRCAWAVSAHRTPCL